MGNRQPLSLSEKELLFRRKQEGASHAEVARELGCTPETVRKLWQAHQRGLKKRKRGRPAAGILSTYPPEMSSKALELKQARPHWGPANVLLELQKQFKGQQVHYPSLSRLSALFKTGCPKAVQRHVKPTPPLSPPPVITRQIHFCWQIDAKEAIKLEDGEVASYLDIRDPVSAVMIASQAFLTTLTPTTYRKITFHEIQDTLRLAFSTWGRPAEIQTDHEDVYAGAHQSDFPMPFTLWLLGLGIRHLFSRDRCPTDQPHIERNHRTLGDMSWKDQPPKNLADFQQQLDACRSRYNHEFPSHASDCQGQAPLVRHPQAVFSGRPYQTASEWDLFDLGSVDQYLAKFRWVRKADCQGVVFVGNHRYGLGKKYNHQSVLVRFQPEQRAFSFETEQGVLIKLLPPIGLEKSDLTGLMPTPIASGVPLQLTFPWVGV